MDHPQYWLFSFLWFVLSIILIFFFTGLTFYTTAILLVSPPISFWSSSSEPQSAFQVWDHLTIDSAQYFGSSRILFSAPTFSHFVDSTIYLSCKSSNLFLVFIFVWHHLRIVIVGFTEDTSSPGKHARRELGLSVSFVVFRGSLLQSTKRTIKVSRCTQRICQ